MQITDLVSPGDIFLGLQATNKEQALKQLCARAAAAAGLPGRLVVEAVMAREQFGSTGMGGGIAIPHARSSEATTMKGVFARLSRPIEFDAIDGKPVDLVFLLVGPEGCGGTYLSALAAISRLLRDSAKTAELRCAKDVDAIFRQIIAQNSARIVGQHANKTNPTAGVIAAHGRS